MINIINKQQQKLNQAAVSLFPPNNNHNNRNIQNAVISDKSTASEISEIPPITTTTETEEDIILTEDINMKDLNICNKKGTKRVLSPNSQKQQQKLIKKKRKTMKIANKKLNMIKPQLIRQHTVYPTDIDNNSENDSDIRTEIPTYSKIVN